MPPQQARRCVIVIPATKALTLRLILGDQLNPQHSWFRAPDPQVVYVLMEIRQETDYVRHHAQKILAIFAAMRDFARYLTAHGHRVSYLAIDNADNRQHLTRNLEWLRQQLTPTAIEYQHPDEWRLDRQLADYADDTPIPVRVVDSEHFFTERTTAASLFAGKRQWRMEVFYRAQRKAHRVLLEIDGSPCGGQWNFDHDNRGVWKGTANDPQTPADRRPAHDHRELWATIVASGASHFGNPAAEALRWPLNRAEALVLLDDFVEHRLVHFGRYQDAMHTGEPFLFHALLSFALNTKMLSPHEVVARTETAWREGAVGMAAAEGFIRQILGWREYVRGVYWAQMPDYAALNVLDQTAPLPEWFWTGRTGMRCLSHAIGQSLEHAYAHHIQRLMVIGNFALLAGINPQELHRWYLGIYIDAFEWVELPNTLGMSQFADGGLLASKPYVSSAAYIERMSNYCRGCAYDRKQRVGPTACPFNALYWDFLQRQRERLQANPRMALPYRQLQRMNDADKTALHARAEDIRRKLDQL